MGAFPIARRTATACFLWVGCALLSGQVVLANSVASFWLSQHGSASLGSTMPTGVAATPHVTLSAGAAGGSLYLWAQPAAGKDLVNWSLNVATSNPEVMALVGAEISDYNPILNPPATGASIRRRWQYVDEPALVIAGTPRLEGLKGFSLSPPLPPDDLLGQGVGIGPMNLAYADPLRSATGAWVLARIDYKLGGQTGAAEIYLEIGDLGANHLNESAAETSIRFGSADDAPLSAAAGSGGQRGVGSSLPDAVFLVPAVFSPSADFDRNGTVNGADLLVWKQSLGPGTGGDADGDGDTDGVDLLHWQRQLGSGGGTTASSSAVPEPAAAVILFIGVLVLTSTSEALRR